jgi:SAM-dependent methyltransferase
MLGLVRESITNYERGGTQKDTYSPDEVVEVQCPYCASERRERLMTEFGSVGIVRCEDCDLMYTSPRIKAPEAVYWGDTAKYEEEARLIFKGLAAHHRDENYLEELRLVKRYKPSGRFLDVGCNMGFLLRKAKEMACWDVAGVEPSPSSSRLAREKWGVKIYNCFLHELPKEDLQSFDIVALSDVFEHVTEPLPFLEHAKRAMKDDGIMYAKVPNGRFSLFKQRVIEKLGKRPRAGIWDSYEHVVHYTDKTLRRMLEKAGFEILELTFAKPVQTPVWHDLVGHYDQYPRPWYLDWRRHLGRAALYYAGFPERLVRSGGIGVLPPNLVAVARKGTGAQRVTN